MATSHRLTKVPRVCRSTLAALIGIVGVLPITTRVSVAATRSVRYPTGRSSYSVTTARVTRDGRVDVEGEASADSSASLLHEPQALDGADLEVTESVSPPSGVSPQGKISYTVVIANHGPLDA